MKTTKKSKATKTAKQARPNELKTVMEPGETRDQALARSDLNPETLTAFTWQHLHSLFSSGELSMTGMVDALKKQSRAVIDGDMGRCEEMLVMQAHTLSGLFDILTQRGIRNFSDYNYSDNLDTAETYLKLAFKAQSLCRATLESLSTIKNPPNPTFIRQANVAHNQQINNGTPEPSRARENKNPPNELTEASHELLPDKGTSTFESEVNSTVETVGKIHRAANGRR